MEYFHTQTRELQPDGPANHAIFRNNGVAESMAMAAVIWVPQDSSDDDSPNNDDKAAFVGKMISEVSSRQKRRKTETMVCNAPKIAACDTLQPDPVPQESDALQPLRATSAVEPFGLRLISLEMLRAATASGAPGAHTSLREHQEDTHAFARRVSDEVTMALQLRC